MTAQRSAASDHPPEDAPPGWTRLVGPGADQGSPRSRPTVRRVLIRFAVANVVAAALLLAGSVYASHVTARNQALADARTTTDLIATLLVQPALDEALLRGDPDAVDRLDAVVRGELRDAAVVRVKIWNADERIVYSDEARLVGRTFPAGEYQVETMADGHVVAELTDLGDDENIYERSAGRLLEVYRTVATPSGERLVLETYFRYDEVTDRQRSILLHFAPITAAALLVLLALQVPLAHRMIRAVRAGDGERLRSSARAVAASTRERRRIAGDLHDGVVQDLSAAPLIMARAVDRIATASDRRADDAELLTDLGAATAAVRSSVTSLRTLMIDIYPPHLADAGLPAALADLAARVESRGVRTRIALPPGLDLPPETAGLLFRVAQEALQNVVKHARATRAVVAVSEQDDVVVLEVSDDGTGFDLAPATGRRSFGLRVLGDVAEAAGATLDLATAPGQGTTVRLRVPR
ncbi:sensor histidine kinase [Trujillonella humicola]|uniref:sensor histidine kinase n=1 Tax=Trujillonella humicola TaxID=3383699 RepID=UPI003906C610